MQNSQQKYIIANIKIPIEILDNGEQIPYMNNISIDFTKSNTLPPLQNIENIDIINLIQDLLKNNTDNIIQKNVIQKRKVPKNITFHKKSKHNYSVKKYEN